MLPSGLNFLEVRVTDAMVPSLYQVTPLPAGAFLPHTRYTRPRP